jgi:glycosyltransferase involved in cell wall biosynthesis
MRIVVASAFEAFSQWAHAINTVKMAQGFARLGHHVTLICRQSSTGKTPPEKLAQMYGIREPLRWVQLPLKLLRCHVNEHWRFALLSLPIALLMRPDLIFARNYIFPWLSSKCGITTVAESHAHPDNNTAPFLRLVDATRHYAFRLWVTISQYLADYYRSIGVPMEKLLVLPDAVDLNLFGRPDRLLTSPYLGDSPNVAYVGHLYDYKGIPTILEAAVRLRDVQFHLVGGWSEDIARQQRRAQELGLANVIFYGQKFHSAVPSFLWHADVLLLPPSQYHPSAVWTSPLKLGEYLASGTPVVATDVPALRSWVTDKEVEFVLADNGNALAEGIRHVLSDKTRNKQLQRAGIRKAQELSYERRAQAILDRCGLVACG